MIRGSRQPGIHLHGGKGSNVVHSGATTWKVTKTPAWLELTWREDLPSGWVLLRGRLIRRGRDYSARLIADTKTGDSCRYDLPISLKGTLLELIRLPPDTERLRLQPMNAVGEFELHEWTLRPLSWLECTAYRWRRLIPVYFKLSREQRHILGLRAITPLIDLKRAYRLAGNTRFYAPSLFYEEWFELFGRLRSTDRQRIQRAMRRWRQTPAFDILIPEQPAAADREETIQSLASQLYRNFALSSHIHETHWVLMPPPGTRLSEHALYWFAHQIRTTPRARLIYCDHDYLLPDGTPCEPNFKPDWSPELLGSTNYIGPAAVFHGGTLIRVLNTTEARDLERIDSHELLLRVSEQLQPDEIHHLAAPLWHLPTPAAERMDRQPARDEATNPVQSHVDRLGIAARAERTPRGHYRIHYQLPSQPPRVSILIPTRDALDYLRRCIDSILRLTTYRNLDILVIDNGSEEAETLTYLRQLAEGRSEAPDIRVLRDDRPFNFAALNNRAARQASGDVLCLLNNDTEVITPNWIEIMLGHLIQPDVGVVGAKLYYSDGRIQHAGDTVGPGGCAHHLHAFLDRDETGYQDRAILAQDLSAVTAACLMTWRDLYLDLGGLDERNLPVAFNDVDYCLRVRASGRRLIWTPHAELYHHESVSRGKDENPKKVKRAARELAYMRKRWGHVMTHDPFYNQNLSYQRPDFSLSHMPSVKRPWL